MFDSNLNCLPLYVMTNLELSDNIFYCKNRLKELSEENKYLKTLKNVSPEDVYNTVDCKYYNDEQLNNLPNNFVPKFSLYLKILLVQGIFNCHYLN